MSMLPLETQPLLRNFIPVPRGVYCNIAEIVAVWWLARKSAVCISWDFAFLSSSREIPTWKFFIGLRVPSARDWCGPDGLATRRNSTDQSGPTMMTRGPTELWWVSLFFGTGPPHIQWACRPLFFLFEKWIYGSFFLCNFLLHIYTSTVII